MTDSTPNMPPPPPPEKTPPASGGKPAKPRKWRRRLKTAILFLVLLLVAARAAVYFLLPNAVRRAAAYYDLNASFERHEIKLLGGDATLWHLVLTPKSGGEPILSTEYVRGDISVLSLLRGRLDVWRAEADGVELLVERDPSGRIPWLERVTASSTKAAPAKAKSPTTRPLDLASPIKIDALRLQHVRARFIDRSVSPPFVTRVSMNMRLSDVGSSLRPTRFEMEVASPPILDSLFVEGTGWATGASIDAEMRARVRGLRPRAAETYLKRLGVTPDANEVTGDFTGRLQLATRPNETNAVGLSLRLQNINLAADGVDALSVKDVILTAPRLTPTQAVVDQLLINGVAVNAGRTPEGYLHAAGLHLTPLPREATTQRSAQPPTRVATTQPTVPFRANVDHVGIKDVTFTFDDQAVQPRTKLAFDVQQLLLKSISFDPSKEPAPLAMDGVFRVPGVAREAKLTGQIQPFGVRRMANVDVQVTGIKPDILTPYLRPFGIECTLQNGTATMALDATAVQDPAGDMVVNALVDKIALRDGQGAALAKLDRIKVGNLRVAPGGDRIAVQALEITGPSTAIRREKAGAFVAAGFRVNPSLLLPASPPATQNASPPPTPSREPSPPTPLPRIEIGHFILSGTKVAVTDETVTPPSSVATQDAGVELRDIILDPKADPAAPGKPGHIRAWLIAPKVAKSLTAEGTIAPRPNGATIDLQLAGDALSLDPVAAYLRPIGFDPLIQSGTLKGHVRSDVTASGNDVTGSLQVDSFRLADGPTILLGVDSLVVNQARLTPVEFYLPDVQIVGAQAVAARDPDGSLIVAGNRLHPSDVPTRSNPTLIGSLAIKDAAMSWTDKAVKPTVHTTLHLNAEVKKMTLHRIDPPADVHATLRVDGAIDQMTVAGKVAPYPDAPAAAVNITATGLRAGPLASYIPPEIRPELKDGRLRATVDAALTPNKDGGQSVRLIASNVDYREGAHDPALMKLDSARVFIPRLDPAGKVIEGDEVSVVGLESHAKMTADGQLHALGVALGGKPSGESTPAAAPTTQPGAPPDLKALAARRITPLLKLKKLNLNVSRFDWSDDRQPGGLPLSIKDMHFAAKAPIDWGGRNADTKAPTPFHLEMAVDPIARQVATDFRVAPLATEPTLAANLAISGINGDGIGRVLPDLQKRVDLSAIRDGEFRAHAETRLRAARREGLLPDLSHPFDAELLLNGVAFRPTPDGPVMLGVNEVRADNIHVDPPAQRVIIRDLEVTKPIAHVTRDKAGITVAQMLVRPGTKTNAPPGEALPAAATVPPSPQPAQPPKGEVRIDKLTVTGIDVVAEDKTSTPPLIIPLENLDLEAYDISSRAMSEDRPIRFNALVAAGKVPIRDPKTGRLESKDLFSQATASGRLSLYPKPTGWAKTSLTGLELVAFSGPAKERGVTVGGGVFDGNADARFQPSGTIDVRSKLVFNDLKLSEGPNGPITQLLKLPAPIDVVIAALEDPSGSITMPIDVSVQNGELKGVGPAAAGAAAGVIATAVASTPIKAGGAVAGLFGLTGEEAKEAESRTVTLTFPPGEAAIDPTSALRLTDVVRQLREDPTAEVMVRHALGTGDVSLVSERVNPPPADAAALGQRLRTRKAELLRLRQDVSARARGQLIAGNDAAAGSLASLRSIDVEIASTDDALDRLYALVRPGADRQADRRTRAACVELAKSRIDDIRENLAGSGAPKAADRVHVAPARFDAPAKGAPNAGTVTLTIVSKGNR